MLFAIALVFSTSAAFATDNTTNTNSSYNNTEDIAAGSSVCFTSAEINKAAYQVKTYTDNHQTLPGYVIIGDTKVTMPQFLKLMAQNVMENGTIESVTLENFDDPKSPNSSETITNGNLTCTEYTTLARQINTYINKYSITTSSAPTNLGKINFNNLVYTFSKILTYNRTYNRLPNYVSITTWSNISNSSEVGSSEGSSTSSDISFTTEQINCAAYKVKTYIEKYNVLPNYVVIGDTKVAMPQFLELMTDNLLAISNGSETSPTLEDVKEPTDISQSLESGTLSKTEYIDVAKTINSYISSNDKAPGYVSTSLGKMGYETMVYSYA
ncbi:MAG: pseudomurein-binding repeat-containing protein, partial [Methanothermobacter sp.]